MITALLAAALAAPEPTAGLFAGIHVAGPNHELYKTPGVEHGPLGPSFPLGIRAGFPVLGPLGLEGEIMGGPATRVGTGFLYGFRAQGNVHLPELNDRYTPMIILGGGYLGLVSQKLGGDVDLAVHMGPALKTRLSEKFSLRTDLRWMLSARKGAAGNPGGHGELLFSLAWNLKPKDIDPDGDNIITELDRCPIETETHNGWRDEDGCPDQLADVTITVRDVEQTRLSNVEVFDGDTLLGHTDFDGFLKLDDLMPERLLQLNVQAPEGMMPGSLDYTLIEGRNRAEIALGWAPGSLLVTASDYVGKPLPALIVATGPENRTWTLGPEGIDELIMKPGKYELLATFEDYEGHAGEVELSEKSGARAHFDAILKSERDEVKVEETRLVTLNPIQFEYDSHVVRPSSMNIVEAVAGVLKTNPYILRVEVGGHASSEGSDTYNLDLSKRRMVEVVRLLTDRGVEKERMKPVGYGESKPITTNDTEEGRAQNRRVEFNILQKEGDQ